MRRPLLGVPLLRPLLLGICLAISVPAIASSSIQLVTQKTGSTKQMSTTVSTKGAAISTASFVSVILDANKYPLSATYMGVQALLDCRTLERRSDGYTVVYERLGGTSLVKSRHYVIALRVSSQSDTKAVIDWYLVKHDFDGTTYTGPYASALNTHADAVYMPYNHGSWSYDSTASTITYSVDIDPGGTVPSWLMSDTALMVFPRELLKVKWGISG